MVPYELTFRILFALSGIAMFATRIYYQNKVLHEDRAIEVKGTRWHLFPGAIAALTAIGFGLAYLFFPSAIPWSYLDLPFWLRWIGLLLLIIGISLLWSAHHHLGRSFHSFVVQKSEHEFVQSGPYRSIRHPIYTAYVLNYLGGGLLAASWVIIIIPTTFFLLMISLRMPEEEAAMVQQFGEPYEEYMQRTGRLLPKIEVGGT
jgi:protein-S-isoprenylcysteine O-methyltransferase Ste14